MPVTYRSLLTLVENSMEATELARGKISVCEKVAICPLGTVPFMVIVLEAHEYSLYELKAGTAKDNLAGSGIFINPVVNG